MNFNQRLQQQQATYQVLPSYEPQLANQQQLKTKKKVLNFRAVRNNFIVKTNEDNVQSQPYINQGDNGYLTYRSRPQIPQSMAQTNPMSSTGARAVRQSETNIQMQQSSEPTSLNSQRFKVLNQRLKTRGNTRRVGYQESVQALNLQIAYGTNKHEGSTSNDRFQNNNVSAVNPGKALVSPRTGHPQQQQIIKTEKPSQISTKSTTNSFNFTQGALGGMLSARNPVNPVLPALEMNQPKGQISHGQHNSVFDVQKSQEAKFKNVKVIKGTDSQSKPDFYVKPSPQISQSSDRSQNILPSGLTASRKNLKDDQTATIISNGSLNSSAQNFSKVKENQSQSKDALQDHSQERRPIRTHRQPAESQLVYPIKGSVARKTVSDDYLTAHERTEIAEYEEIWFLAPQANKYQPTKLERLVNNGFDDNEGYYRFKQGDQISYRYEVQEIIGKGAFGNVIKCIDHKTQDLVAIKIVKNQKKYYYQAAVEAKLLLLLKENDPDNMERVIKLNDYFVWRNHLCLTFDLYQINLYEFIKMYDYQGFDYGLIRRFAIQLLAGLKYLKALGVIHCDLKPENILMKQKDKSGIVIADFGSGCLENEIVYTYIQSRFYRAPDIMLGVFPYTEQIDMWSFGCILIELFTGFPLFPGTNEREQMQLVIDVIGTPNDSVLQRSTRKDMFTQFKEERTAVPAAKGSEVLSEKEKEERLKYIMTKLREVPDPLFVNLISRCLEWDPLKRLTPDEGLQHEWILKGLPPGVLQQHQLQFQQKKESPRKQEKSSPNPKANTNVKKLTIARKQQ